MLLSVEMEYVCVLFEVFDVFSGVVLLVVEVFEVVLVLFDVYDFILF